jgi:hypothetical protein
MNVFAVDPCPLKSAEWLADQHVVKMTLESAQIACSALHLRGVVNYNLYRPTHLGHPCVVVASKDDAYLHWVIEHGFGLAAEYSERFGKSHASLTRLELCRRLAKVGGADKPAKYPLAMPDEYKSGDPHTSYLAYLRAKYAAWKKEGREPRWKRITSSNPFREIAT